MRYKRQLSGGPLLYYSVQAAATISHPHQPTLNIFFFFFHLTQLKKFINDDPCARRLSIQHRTIEAISNEKSKITPRNQKILPSSDTSFHAMVAYFIPHRIMFRKMVLLSQNKSPVVIPTGVNSFFLFSKTDVTTGNIYFEVAPPRAIYFIILLKKKKKKFVQFFHIQKLLHTYLWTFIRQKRSNFNAGNKSYHFSE